MKKTKKIIIFGNDKMAQLAKFYFDHDSEYETVAFTVDDAYIVKDKFEGLSVLPFENIEEKFSPKEYHMFVAIGYKKLNMLRQQKYNEAKDKGYELASYVSSKLTSWGDTKIGDNCFILEHQVLQPFLTIGNNVVLWSGSHFGHDVEIGDHTFISSQTILSGHVKVGRNCFIGINTSIRDQVVIGDECIIGAGATINNNVKSKSVLITESTKPYVLDSEQFERMMDISKKK